MRNLKENIPQQLIQNENTKAGSANDRAVGDSYQDPNASWKSYFSLGSNVRFTRTPEAELRKRRGEDLPDINGRNGSTEKASVEEQASVEVEKLAQEQPMAVAAMQQAVSETLIVTPTVPVPPALPNITPAAAQIETQVETISVGNVQSDEVFAGDNSASVHNDGLAPASFLSDFAFWEGYDVDLSALKTSAPSVVVPTVAEAASAPVIQEVVQEVVAPAVQAAPVVQVEAAEPAPVAEKAPAPSLESIMARYRIREWSKADTVPAPVAEQKVETVAEAPVAAPVAIEPVQVAPAPVMETPAPKAEAPVAEVKAEPVVEAPVVKTANPTNAALQRVVDVAQVVPTPRPAPVPPVVEAAAPIEAVETIAESTDDEVELQIEAYEDEVTEIEDAPVAEAVAEVEAPAKSGPSIALYQPQYLPRTVAPVASGEYDFPPRDLLQDAPSSEGNVITQEMLERSAGLLESVLEDFGVRGEIIHVRPGPVVTLYEFEPAPGVKSSRVIGLADDIARSMSALSARVAVVPGRNVIGIELPNANRETVFLREMIESRAFEASNYRLPLCLGKGIGGEPIIAELAKMPHLLVAGTTGSGKSVAINTMILSLLYRLKPEECRLIMVDPKMLELSIYDGIPHLLTPVVTDPKKAVVALKWAVREMEERYRKMARLGVRNIEGFNARAASAKGKGETVMCTVQSGFDKETGEPTYIQEELDLTPMPYIVVIVDEMADLMMVAGKEIEGAIQRLAQMARAAGIHLIMATQRPSVDVITGTIKANFPTRISFQVTSKIDSRTILGEQGAEQLLGQGDMLHMAGGGRIVRVHGPFVSDAEVENVVAHLKEQGRPDYLATVTEDESEEEPVEEAAVFDNTAMGADDGDDLYEQAIKVVMRDKKCSTSYIQRRLGIGYNRAASLVERMEQDGLVGAANHVGKREILTGNRD